MRVRFDSIEPRVHLTHVFLILRYVREMTPGRCSMPIVNRIRSGLKTYVSRETHVIVALVFQRAVDRKPCEQHDIAGSVEEPIAAGVDGATAADPPGMWIERR